MSKNNEVKDQVAENVANVIHTGMGCFGCMMYMPFIVAIIFVFYVCIGAFFV